MRIMSSKLTMSQLLYARVCMYVCVYGCVCARARVRLQQ